MAENVLLKEQLTEQMIGAGAELLQKLDEIGLPVSLAMWFFDSEVNEWQLRITTPWYSSRGPQEIYLKLREARDKMGALKAQVPLLTIWLLEPRQELAKAVASSVHIAPGSPPQRYKGGFRGYNDDALIYRSVAA